jgi:hypothetical protein
MNYNNPYFNPYQQYPYSNGYTTNQQIQQPQTSYLPLTFINGIEGAKAFIVAPNQIVYLKDSDSNILYEKKADHQGKYTLTAYELKQIDINRPVQEQTAIEYATTNDLKALETIFVQRMDILSKELEKLVKNENKEV